MKNIFTTRRRIIIAGITTAAVLGTGGAAFAYFAASGTGTGSATVGAAGTWTVTAAAAKGGPLYPDGTSTETMIRPAADKTIRVLSRWRVVRCSVSRRMLIRWPVIRWPPSPARPP